MKAPNQAHHDAERICDLLHPFDSNQRVVAVLDFVGYFDESEQGDKAKDESGKDTFTPVVYSVAGYVGTKDNWAAFSEAWERVLNQPKFGVTELHTADCEGGYGEFIGWSREKKKELFAELIPLIETYALVSVYATVCHEDFERIILPTLEFSTINDPYFFCQADCVLAVLAHLSRSLPEGESIAFFFDRKQKTAKRAATNYDIIEELQKQLGRYNHMGALGQGTRAQFKPLQAADLLAYRACKSRYLKMRPQQQFRDWESALALPNVPQRRHSDMTPGDLQDLQKIALSPNEYGLHDLADNVFERIRKRYSGPKKKV